jgi:small-conductance mechanosensitive channel
MKNEAHSSYKLLIIMAVVHFFAMYVLMYSMVDNFSNIYSNFNQFYMAGIMTIPMLILEIFLMNFMYRNKKLNLIIVATSVVIFIILFLFIRNQTAISDEQFLKSMIPHHAAAILMCEEAPITDAEIQNLCQKIISNQQSEIEQMKIKLNEIK